MAEQHDRRTAACAVPLFTIALAVTVFAMAHAEAPAKTFRIGFIGFQDPGLEWGMLAPFQARLRELGWVDGGNLSTAYRWADGSLGRYASIVTELVESNLDLIVTPCGPPLFAIRKRGSTVPLVARCMDFRDFGREVDSPSRPGGYTTGVTYFSPGAIPRRLALLKEAVPGLSHVGVLYRPRSDWIKHWADIEAAAGSLNLRLLRVEWVHKHQLPAAFDTAIDQRVGALLTLGDGATYYHRHALFELAAARRLPVLYDFPMFPAAEDVGLMAYYANVAVLFRTVAEQVDRILKGGRPGDMPIEGPRVFSFIINRRAARGLDLELPASLLKRANRVMD